MSNTILIADSGSTKTDWVVVKDSLLAKTFCTKGINPYFQSFEEIKDELEDSLVPQLTGIHVDAVYFYGAGCNADKAHIVCDAICFYVKTADVNVYSDLLAAVHSTCGCNAGIACILGTGSNSCFFDGEQIVKNVPPLGFILGDEGGGATLGCLLVSDILKGLMPEDINREFFGKYGLTQAEILDSVYRQPFPNRFLAGFSTFLYEHIDVPEIYAIVFKNFVSFFMRNLLQYDCKRYEVNFVGSVAYHYTDILKEAAEAVNIRIGKILKNPINGLVDYYNLKNSQI